MAAILYPLVNGNRHDWSSLDIKVLGVSVFGIKSLDYNDELTPGKVYGSGAQKIARTRGQYDADASIEFYRAEWTELVVPLILAAPQNKGLGLLECTWNIDVNYLSEGGLPTTTDNIVGCRLTKPSHSGSAGSDAIAIKCDIDVMYIIRNGVVPITNLKK